MYGNNRARYTVGSNWPFIGIANPMVAWQMTSRDPKRSRSWPRYLWSSISRQPWEIHGRFILTTNRKPHIENPVFTWPMTSRDPKGQSRLALNILKTVRNGRIATKLAHNGPQKSPHPGCARGQGQGQRSRDTDTFVISRKRTSLMVKPGNCPCDNYSCLVILSFFLGKRSLADKHDTCTGMDPKWT